MNDWKVRVGDVSIKAASVEELKAWLIEGRIRPENYVLHPVLQRWMYVRELEELKPQIAQIDSASAAGSVPQEASKKCPACAEAIQGAAVKCNHCGTVLVSPTLTRPALGAKPFRALAFVLVSVVGIALLALLVRRPNTSDPGMSQTREAPATTEQVQATPIRSQSLAREYASRVRVALDSTTVEELVAQMPEGMQPALERTATGRRKFTWRFSDGSQIIALFTTRGPEGSGLGLVLYAVDLKD